MSVEAEVGALMLKLLVVELAKTEIPTWPSKRAEKEGGRDESLSLRRRRHATSSSLTSLRPFRALNPTSLHPQHPFEMLEEIITLILHPPPLDAFLRSDVLLPVRC